MIKMGKLAIQFILLTGIILALALNSNAAISLIDFNIENGKASTATPLSTLYITATDGNTMMFSCDNSTYSSWVDYSATYSFNLETGAGCSAGDGAKTVYVKVLDATSKQDTGSDSITLDTTAPTINWVWQDANSSDGNSYLNYDYNIIIRLSGGTGQTANASIGSIPDFNLFDDGAHSDVGAGDGVYGGSFDVNEFGKSTSCMIYVVGKLSDALGNQSTKNSFNQICIDVNKPTYASENPKNYVNNRTPDINVQLLDPNSGIKTSVVQMWVNSVPVAGSDLTFTTVSGGKRLDYAPDSNLSGTTINIAVRSVDNASNIADVNWSFVIDENAPNTVSDLNVRLVPGDNDLNITWSAPTDIGGSGISYFILYRNTSAITNATVSSASVVSQSISSTNREYRDAMSAENEDITYYYSISAVDKAGNTAGVSNSHYATVPDLNAPGGIIVSADYYTGDPTPDINVSGTDVDSAKLSCDDLNYSNASSPPIENFSLISGNGCLNEDGNKTLYIIVLDNHDNNFKVERSIYLDRVKPSQPTISSTENTDSTNTVIWTASTDEGSGIGHYRIYFNGDGNVGASDYQAVSYDGNYSHDVAGATKYCYRIQAEDKAGNRSLMSGEACQLIDVNSPKITVSFPDVFSRAGKNFFAPGKHKIVVKANYQLETATVTVEYSDGNSEVIELTGPGSTLSGLMDLNAIDGNTLFKIATTDLFEFGNETEAYISIDSQPPEIRSAEAWQKTEELIGLRVKLPVDAKRLEIVQCEKGKCLTVFDLTGDDLNNGFIEKDWNAAEAEVNDVNLAFRAFDDLGNMRQKTVFILLFTGIEEKMLAINSIQNALKASLGLMKDYMIEASEEIKRKVSEAEEHLKNARIAVEANDIGAIQSEILSASALLSEIERDKPQITVSNTQILDYEADRDLLSANLAEHLTGIALMSSKNLWKTLAIKREIQSIEITENEKREKHALVIIYIKNSGTKKTESFNLIEKIPKTFLEKASDILTNSVIEIMKPDPIVSFYIPALEPGEERILKYKPSKPITEEKLKEIEAQTPSLFSIPIPLASEFEPMASFLEYGQQEIPIPLIAVVIAALGYYIYWRVKRQ